jgi:RNA polymerase sigma-70 factor, ECF subfamily
MTASFLAGLLGRSRRGDEEAFKKLVEATRERLFWTVRRMVGREALAEEIVQDAYVALWGLSDAASPREPEAWLRRFCVNRAIDHLRREETKRPHDGNEALERVASAQGPEEAMGLKELEGALHSALSILPHQEHAAFVLKLIEGRDYVEIAALLGVSESTVRNQVMQARRKVEKSLSAMGIEV